MRRHRFLTRDRGYAMLLVLVIVMVLSAGAASLYVMTESRRLTFEVMSRGSLARSNAQRGVQDAIAKLRSGAISVAALAIACGGPNADLPSTCNGIYQDYSSSPADNHDTNMDNQAFRVRIYSRTVNQQLQSVVVDAIGYAGAQGSPNLVTARIEAEVQTAFMNSGPGNCINGGC